MSRTRLSRVTLLCVALVMVFSLLVACGGDDGDGGGGSGDLPVPSGADRLAEDEVSSEDLDAADVNISNAKAAAYRISNSSFDEVSEYYESGVEDDGWTVEEHVAFGELMIAVLHNDDDLVIATAMSGAAAKEQTGALELGDLDVDVNKLEDDDVVVLAARFTCNEDSVEACITAMDLGL